MRRHPIVCIETGDRFRGMKDAAREGGASYSHVRESVTRGVACKGKHYRRLGEPGVPLLVPRNRAVYCETTKTLHASMSVIVGGPRNSKAWMRLLRAIERGQPYEGKRYVFATKKHVEKLLLNVGRDFTDE